MSRAIVPAVAFFIGLTLLVAWANHWFGDWGTFVIGALLLSGGAFGVIEFFEDHEEMHR